VQRCCRPETRVEDEVHTAAEIAQLIARIRDAYGDCVLDYKEVSVALSYARNVR
jgi:hypothetical protein